MWSANRGNAEAHARWDDEKRNGCDGPPFFSSACALACFHPDGTGHGLRVRSSPPPLRRTPLPEKKENQSVLPGVVNATPDGVVVVRRQGGVYWQALPSPFSLLWSPNRPLRHASTYTRCIATVSIRLSVPSSSSMAAFALLDPTLLHCAHA